MIFKITTRISMTILLTISFSCLNAQIISTFDSTDEGWRVTGDPTSPVPQYYQTGGNPGGYISAIDGLRNDNWYWSAPSKFYGNQISAFGDSLQFDLKQSGSNNQFDAVDISITGSGITIVGDLAQNPLTTWTHYEVPFDTTFAWRLNTLTGPFATNTDIQSVLTDITDLKIRGEYIAGADSGQLDNVILPSTSLPVYLLSFTATIVNDKTLLQWSTTNEINSSHFDVEYSNDGRSFKSVGTVSAANNSTIKRTYYWNSNNAANGSSFYRLKMVDKD